MKKNRRKTTDRPTFTLLDELAASPTQPMSDEFRRHQLTAMHSGLDAMERREDPTPQDWRLVSDAVNLFETLVDMGVVVDEQGLLQDAARAMAEAGQRHLATGRALRLDGPGIQAVRAVLADYSEILAQLPQRVYVRCHRRTEARIREIRLGKRRPGDVVVSV